MAFNLTRTLINSRLVAGNAKPGNEIALRIDQARLRSTVQKNRFWCATNYLSARSTSCSLAAPSTCTQPTTKGEKHG